MLHNTIQPRNGCVHEMDPEECLVGILKFRFNPARFDSTLCIIYTSIHLTAMFPNAFLYDQFFL
jgi:hypothetical protein